MKPVKEFHTGGVLLSTLCVQLVPQYLGHPLSRKKRNEHCIYTTALSYTNVLPCVA